MKGLYQGSGEMLEMLEMRHFGMASWQRKNKLIFDERCGEEEQEMRLIMKINEKKI